MSINKYLPELLEAGIIDSQTADRIAAFYQNKKTEPDNRLFVVFGVLGATLVGLGIILILAHNWDNFPRFIKTIFAFVPLIAGQVICGYAFFKKSASITWRESSATFLFFAVGACIALVSQIYNIPGDLSSYLLTWMLLCFPLIYVMRSSIVSLLYIGGITWYACDAGYWSYPITEPYWYWLLLGIALPHYYFLYRQKPTSNFTMLHNWMIPLSVVITLGTLTKDHSPLMFVAYFSLFGSLYLIGVSPLFKSQKIRNNGFLVLGSLGTVVLLLALSFREMWKEIINEYLVGTNLLLAPETYVVLFLTALAVVLLFRQRQQTSWKEMEPLEFVFLLFVVLFIIGHFSPFTATVLTNILVFAVGILIVRKGSSENHLGILNYGLLIVTLLLICRFFDTDISFVIRGLLFVAIGVGFFMVNYRMIQKRKSNEK